VEINHRMQWEIEPLWVAEFEEIKNFKERY
jgi:hypothetical protein